MSHPKAVILCKSVHHGSTAKVAGVMAAALQAEVVSPEEFPYTSLESVELLGVGSGVYYGRMHSALFEWLRGLPDTTTATCPAFVFSTSGLPFLFKLWHAPLIRELSRKGFEVMGDFHCRGHDSCWRVASTSTTPTAVTLSGPEGSPPGFRERCRGPRQ